MPALPKRPNSYWYAEVGLYQTSSSTPSTSSTENSGNSTQVNLPEAMDRNSLEYYNMRNEEDSYNGSVDSFERDDGKRDNSLYCMTDKMHLNLQDEPLYQFYDAAVIDVSFLILIIFSITFSYNNHNEQITKDFKKYDVLVRMPRSRLRLRLRRLRRSGRPPRKRNPTPFRHGISPAEQHAR